MGQYEEFFEIADQLVDSEANEHLDIWLSRLDTWIRQRRQSGLPVSLRCLIDQMMQEPNQRGPVLVCLSAALWRLWEKENADAK